MAGIYKRGKTWWGRCQRAGKDIRVSLETRSESVARKRLAAWTAELEASAWGEKPRMTLNEVADLFIREHVGTLRPSTARRYGASIEWLDQRLGSLLLNQITSAVLVEFETWRRSAGVSAPTIRRDLSTLSSIFTFAIEREWIDANPIGPFLRQRRRRGLREATSRRLAELGCSPHMIKSIAGHKDSDLRVRFAILGARAALAEIERDGVVVPADDPARNFSDSALPPQMIEAGMDALEKTRSDMRNYVPGETIDWDCGMVAVAVYRAMVAAAPTSHPQSADQTEQA